MGSQRRNTLSSDGSLRPAVEDQIADGAILARFQGASSPEAQAALAVFERFLADLGRALETCSSGKELIGRCFASEVDLAANLNARTCVPRLIDDCYRNVAQEATSV